MGRIIFKSDGLTTGASAALGGRYPGGGGEASSGAGRGLEPDGTGDAPLAGGKGVRLVGPGSGN